MPTFGKLRNPPDFSQYFDFSPEDATEPIEEVLLFSGGLDSLAGIVQEGIVAGRRVAMVSHRSVSKVDTKQKALMNQASARCSKPPLHVPVWVNKDKGLSREFTQRTRSFLYSSLAATVARMLNLSRIRFFENGVTSWNLPISEQLTSAKASRTTHPQALTKLEALFGAITGQEFKIQNPLLWKTKAEVASGIQAAGCGELIQYCVSCQHTLEQTNEHSHCGRCFQCVGRRFAMLASTCPQDDPADDYKIDLLTGSRSNGIDRTLVESYYRAYLEMGKLTDNGFFERYGEINRALARPVLKHLSSSADEVASNILSLHRRQSSHVEGVLQRAFKTHTDDLLHEHLPETCLVALALPEKYRQPLPPITASDRALAERGGGCSKVNGQSGHYSDRDEQVFQRVITLCKSPSAFEMWADAELLSRIRPHRLADPLLNGRNENSLRACFRRIRVHHGFQLSRKMKNIGNEEPDQLSKK